MLVCVGYDSVKRKYKIIDTNNLKSGEKCMQERNLVHKYTMGIDIKGIPFKEKIVRSIISYKYYIDPAFKDKATYYSYTLNQIQDWTILHVYLRYRLDSKQQLLKGRPEHTYIYYKDNLLLDTHDCWFPHSYIDYQTLDGRELYLIGSNEINVRLRYNIDGTLLYQALQNGAIEYINLFEVSHIDEETGRGFVRYIGNREIYDLQEHLTDENDNRVLYHETEYNEARNLFMLKYPQLQPLITEIFQKFINSLPVYDFLFKDYFIKENNQHERGNRNRFIFFDTAFRLEYEDLFIQLAKKLNVLDIHANISYKGDTATLKLVFPMMTQQLPQGYIKYYELPYLQDKFQITIKR